MRKKSKRAVSRTVLSALVGLFIIGLGLGLGSFYSIGSLSPKSHSHTTTTALPPPPLNGSVSVTCSPAPVVVGSKTSCTAILTNYSTTPSGTVSWKSNATGSFSASSCTLSSGSCSVSYRPSSSGEANINGSYSGDKSNPSSFGTYSLAIAREASQVTLSCSAVLTVGESSKCTTTVAGYGTPIGNASFTVSGSGTFNPVSCTLNKGSCSVQYTPLSVSSESITASYTGDSNNNASSSIPYVFTVGARSSSVSISCSPNSPTVGSSTTCTATINGFNPTGTVVWQTNATGAFSSTSCSLSTSFSCFVTYTQSAAGSANLTVSYSGDSNNLGSSGSSTLTVTQAVTSTSVNCVPPSLEVGSSTSCTATVSGGVSPSGSVSFTTSGSGSVTPAAASCTLTSGSCSVSFTGVTSGSVTVNANYGGDPSNVGSFGTTQISVAVGLVAPTISANPTTIDSGQGSTLVTITSFSGGIPSYTCQWLVEGPGSGSYSSLGSSFACNAGETPSTTTGALFSTGTWSFELQVTDSSTPAVTVASNAATVLVNPALTAGAITPTNPTIDSGQSITLTANPTGGVLQYSYQWYTSPSCAGPGIHGETSSSYTASPSSTTTYYYLVTDSSGSSACSPGDTVTVNPALTSPTISANSTTLLPGQTSYLVSTPVSTGTSPYTYQWLVESPFSPTFVPITGATSSSYYFVTSSSTQTGTWSFELLVTDATGASVISNPVSVTVS